MAILFEHQCADDTQRNAVWNELKLSERGSWDFLPVLVVLLGQIPIPDVGLGLC